jgi:hypothetical protein
VLLLAALIGTGIRISSPSGSTSAALPSHRAVDAREWQVIAKDPDAHEGERIVVHGHVTQFDPAGNKTFRANVDGVAHGGDGYAYLRYKTTTMLSGDTKALEGVVSGDLFTAEVTVRGSISYDTQIGGSATVPVLTVDSIRVTG